MCSFGWLFCLVCALFVCVLACCVSLVVCLLACLSGLFVCLLVRFFIICVFVLFVCAFGRRGSCIFVLVVSESCHILSRLFCLLVLTFYLLFLLFVFLVFVLWRPDLPDDSIGGSTFDPYGMASVDSMSVFSAASSVVNPSSMRGIVHR